MDLLLTLGHNSSAIGVQNYTICGWEQERLTRKKSSSAFPVDAIQKCQDNISLGVDRIFISHWFDAFNFDSVARKDPGSRIHRYYNPSFVKSLGGEVFTLAPDITHHDAHAWSGLAFVESHMIHGDFKAHCIVADGFGNQQEVLSVYEVTRIAGHSRVRLQWRVRGYQNSLGLLYQYATSFCGMKENQDEYKFLGYESHIDEVACDAGMIREKARHLAREMIDGSFNFDHVSDTFINLDMLANTKETFTKKFQSVVGACGASSERDIRIVIGYFIQQVLEIYYAHLVQVFRIENAILAGGVHYNVKLNNAVLKMVPGWVSVVPLAGDQGAAIGLYRSLGHHFNFSSLLWGHRSLTPTDASKNETFSRDDVIYTTDREEYVEQVSRLVKNDFLVNTVTGSMEFGPRALCNTSTLALANTANMDTINALNGRNTVMPFAPVVLAEHATKYFDPSQLARVVGSSKFMVITFDYKKTLPELDPNYHGVMHKYPQQKLWSGRPQVVTTTSDQPIRDILLAISDTAEMIINTSLNVHGVPIVYSLKDALDDMAYNRSMALNQGLKRPILVIGDF